MKNKNTALRDWTSHSRIINGCWQFSEGHSENASSPVEVLGRYVEAGFSVFDGADIYTGVEEIFWEVHTKFSDCLDLRFHTKHVPDLDDVQAGTVTKEKTITHIERSCERMNTSSLSNVQFHWWDYEQSGYDISLSALLDLQAKWVIEHLGVTNTNVKFLMRLEDELGFVPMTSQNQYSLIDRRAEQSLIPYLSEKNIWLYCYGSLMGWLLSSRYLDTDRPAEPLENRSLRKYLRVLDDWADWETFQELLTTLHDIGLDHQASISEISIAWLLHQEWVNSVILGVRNSKHLSSLGKSLDIDLSQDELKSIDTIYAKWTPLKWDVFDLERYEPQHRDIMKFNLNSEENIS